MEAVRLLRDVYLRYLHPRSGPARTLYLSTSHVSRIPVSCLRQPARGRVTARSSRLTVHPFYKLSLRAAVLPFAKQAERAVPAGMQRLFRLGRQDAGRASRIGG